MSQDKATCPGCGNEVFLTPKTLDDRGARVQMIIQKHNPVPTNPKKLSVNQECPGSDTPVGSVKEKTIVWG